MQLTTLDWSIVIGFFLVSLIIGAVTSRRAGKNYQEFFLSGRGMPWWLLGVSMVATTFSADTPNLVTDIIRQNGIAGNWAWWAFLLTGMLTVFVYAKLWRRSGILTDLEFYELRYSGPEAAFLRGFRAIYLGVVFNVFIMATVILAGIKIGSVLLGLTPLQTVLIASGVTLAYTVLGGLRSVILTDFFQFALAMVGMVWACIYILELPEVGGLDGLLSHPNVVENLDFLPSYDDPEVFFTLLILPIAVQWWSVWYPGAEPGGGGYIVQRMLSAKDEKNAIGATLFFNIAHYALRPWPWILIALASLVVFPATSDMVTAFPDTDPSLIRDDFAFPAMLSFLPAGLLGLVAAGLIAAFMSTISTHLNWGASYVVNDVYKRFLKPDAGDKELVLVGRLSTVVLMILAAALAPVLENAKTAFDLLLQIGAGTGLIFILRWFWWRINAYTEIAGMVASFLIAVAFFFFLPETPTHIKLVFSILLTTVAWLLTTIFTRPTNNETLVAFYQRVRPHAAGWFEVLELNDLEKLPTSSFSRQLLSMFAAVFLVYASLFSFGYFIYGEMGPALIGLAIAVLCGVTVWRNWARVQDEVSSSSQ
jgi:Na+/proline symporter